MNSATIERPLTYEDERGKPTPSYNHGVVQANLIGELLKHTDFRVVSELTLQIGIDRHTPDLSIYPRSKPVDFKHDIPRPTDPPLMAVEIFSPQQGSQDVLDKVDVYFAHGVKSCWVVSPPQHHIDIYTPDGAVRRYADGVAIDPVLGVSAELAVVFS